MNRRDVQRRLLASETFWFGGVRDVPKVFETHTRNHVDPVVGGAGAGSFVAELVSHVPDPEAPDSDAYKVVVDALTGDVSYHPLPAE